MKSKPIYEFLLWDNCNNKCKFCHQRNNPRLFNIIDRKLILNEVISFINSDKFIKGSHILVVGGEIFDKKEDIEFLSNFFIKIVEYMKNNIIDLLYINTNLIYKDVSSLYNLLNLIEKNNLFDRLKFTTSYDIYGRFTKNTKEIMLNNLLKIKKDYKDINIVTNIILTKQACEYIYESKFNINLFMKKYNTKVNLLPYICLTDDMLPSRELLFKIFKKLDKENPEFMYEYIKNFDLDQDKLLYYYDKDKGFTFCSCIRDKCGHSINFKKYSKSNTCFVCDLKEVFNKYF